MKNNVPYVFISYSSRRQSIAETIQVLLEREGIDTWMAPRDIPAGSKYAAVVNRAVKSCTCILAILSKPALESEWIAGELDLAMKHRKPRFGLKIEDLELSDDFEYYFAGRQLSCITELHPLAPEWQRIVTDIRSCISSERKRGADIETSLTSQVCYADKDNPKERKLPFSSAELDIPSDTEHTPASDVNLSSIAIGETVTLGRYPQAGISAPPEPIDWILLARKNGKLLLVSKYGLDALPYNREVKDGNKWESSSLRQWILNDFAEKAGLRDIDGELTCLNVEDALRYFKSDMDRICWPTNFAIARGAWTWSTNGACGWWLSSPGKHHSRAAFIYAAGEICTYGVYVDDSDYVIRPAIWINEI